MLASLRIHKTVVAHNLYQFFHTYGAAICMKELVQIMMVNLSGFYNGG